VGKNLENKEGMQNPRNNPQCGAVFYRKVGVRMNLTEKPIEKGEGFDLNL